MHALIIEDESLIALLIEDHLRELGFTSFDLAACPQSAISAAAKRCPDLITSDVQLDPGCGINTVRTICDTIPIPVIFITGNVEDVRDRMPDCPALTKPFSAQQLAAAVQEVLR